MHWAQTADTTEATSTEDLHTDDDIPSDTTVTDDTPEDTPSLAAGEAIYTPLPVDIYHKIKTIHNAIQGHFGVARTIRKLKQQGHTWRYMRRHVKQFINECSCCQKLRHLKPKILDQIVPHLPEKIRHHR